MDSMDAHGLGDLCERQLIPQIKHKTLTANVNVIRAFFTENQIDSLLLATMNRNDFRDGLVT